MLESCAINLFGGLRVQVGDRTIHRFPTQKTALLLAYLAVHHGRRFSREAVAEVLWPEDDPERIRHRLNQAISTLRRMLHIPGRGANEVLDADSHTVGLNPNGVKVDVAIFDHLIAESVGLDTSEKVDLLKQALEIYGGLLLPEFFEDWVSNVRLIYSEKFGLAAKTMQDHLQQTGDAKSAVQLLHHRMANEADESALQQSLIHSLADFGEPDLALGRLRQAEREARLNDNEQRFDFTAWRAKLIQGSSKKSLAPDSKSRISKPQLPISRTNHLPRFPDTYIGNAIELELLTDMVRCGKRLVVICGAVGVGKSRFAVELAWNLVPHFSGGLCLLDLDRIDRDSLAFAVARGLHVGETNTANDKEALFDAIRRQGKTLVILENIENRIEEVRTEISDLVFHCPELHILAPSRMALRLAGECLYLISSLAIPNLGQKYRPSSLIEIPSVRLFLDRAQTSRPDFQLTARTAETLAKICHRLGGNPLAIEMAASWTRTLSLSALWQRINKGFEHLEHRRADVTERHRSIRSMMSAMVANLTPQQYQMLEAASIFESKFSVGPLGLISGCEDPDRVLQELLDRSLFEHFDFQDVHHFTVPRILREHVRANMTEESANRIRMRHAEYCHKACLEKLPIFIGNTYKGVSESQSDWLMAIDYFRSHGQFDKAVDIAYRLTGLWLMFGPSPENVALLYDLNREAQQSLPLVHSIKALTGLGWMQMLTGDFDGAESSFVQAHSTLTDEYDIRLHFWVAYGLSLVSHIRGRYDEESKHLETMFRAADPETWPQLNALANIRKGNQLLEAGEIDLSKRSFMHATLMAQSANSWFAEAMAQLNVSYALLLDRDYDAARTAAATALSICRAVKCERLIRECQICFAWIERELGNFSASRQWLANLYNSEPTHPRLKWHIVQQLAYLLFEEERYSEGLHYLGALHKHQADHGFTFDVRLESQRDQYIVKAESVIGVARTRSGLRRGEQTTLDELWPGLASEFDTVVDMAASHLA